MGYYVRVLKPKSRPEYWKLQFTSHKMEHTKSSTAKKPKKEWDIPKSRWHSLGFQQSMTIEQAKARAKQLNAIAHLKRVEAQRLSLDKEKERLHLKFLAAVPELYKAQFEKKYIHDRQHGPKWRNRFHISWRAVQKMLIHVQLDPIDWYDEMFRFYDYFHQKQFSMSYLRRLLILTNLWGSFLSRKMGTPFAPIPIPRGKERARLLEAFFSKTSRHAITSDPLTPQQLSSAKGIGPFRRHSLHFIPETCFTLFKSLEVYLSGLSSSSVLSFKT